MAAQPFELGKDRAQCPRPRRRLDATDRFHSLAERQAVGECGGAGETLGEQKGAVGGLSFRDLFNAAILVEEAGNGTDDVLTHGFEQKVG